MRNIDIDPHNIGYEHVFSHVRLLILGCLVISRKKLIINQREAVYQSSGQLLRPFSTSDTPQRVMCGVMGWSCTRYGH